MTYKIFFSIVLLLLGITLGTYFYSQGYFSRPISIGDIQINSKNTAVNDQEVKNAIKTTDPSTQNSFDVKTQTEYQKLIDKELEKDGLDKDTKKLLLLRKASSLAIANTEDFDSAKRQEAVKILQSITFDQNEPNDFYKSLGTVLMIKMYREWCFDGKAFKSLLTRVPYYNDNYSSIYDKYQDVQLATMILVSNFMENSAKLPRLEQDTTFLAQRGIVNAMLVRAYADKLSEENLKTFKERLAKAVDLYPFSAPVTVVTFMGGNVGPLVDYSAAYSISKTSSGKTLTKEDNKKIDENFEKVYLAIDTYKVGSPDDKYIPYFLNSVYYLDSVNLRYTGKELETKEKYIIGKIKTSVDGLSPGYRSMLGYFLRDGVYGNSTWEKMKNNFITLGRKYPEIKSYLVKFGIKESDIQKKTNDWKNN